MAGSLRLVGWCNGTRCGNQRQGRRKPAAALPQLPLSYDLVTIKTDVDLHAELSDGLESLRRTSPKWSQLAVDFKRWGFRTWLKEAESRMHEAADGDLFGSDTIGEQAALDMETSSEKS